jgi:hypothetical protein
MKKWRRSQESRFTLRNIIFKKPASSTANMEAPFLKFCIKSIFNQYLHLMSPLNALTTHMTLQSLYPDMFWHNNAMPSSRSTYQA